MIVSIEQYNRFSKQSTLHPLVTLIRPTENGKDMAAPVTGKERMCAHEDTEEGKDWIPLACATGSSLQEMQPEACYALFFPASWCGDTRYGLRCCDFQYATLSFKLPGSPFEVSFSGNGDRFAGLLFKAELFRDPALAAKKSSYTFFSYKENEALHLSEREYRVVQDCLERIHGELDYGIDAFSMGLLASHTGLLLDYCRRFYERQFIVRSDIGKAALHRFEDCLQAYWQRPGRKTWSGAIRHVKASMDFSPAYLDDFLRFETGKKLSEAVLVRLFQVVMREIGQPAKSLEAIAAEFGFEDIGTFRCVCSKVTGKTPEEWRAQSIPCRSRLSWV